MRKLAVDQPARGEERDYQRGAEEESQQVVRNGGCFHGSKVGQAFRACLTVLSHFFKPRT